MMRTVLLLLLLVFVSVDKIVAVHGECELECLMEWGHAVYECHQLPPDQQDACIQQAALAEMVCMNACPTSNEHPLALPPPHLCAKVVNNKTDDCSSMCYQCPYGAYCCCWTDFCPGGCCVNGKCIGPNICECHSWLQSPTVTIKLDDGSSYAVCVNVHSKDIRVASLSHLTNASMCRHLPHPQYVARRLTAQQIRHLTTVGYALGSL